MIYFVSVDILNFVINLKNHRFYKDMCILNQTTLFMFFNKLELFYNEL
jgi:hypothetical protein